MKIVKTLIIFGVMILALLFLAISGSEKSGEEYFPVDSCTDIIVGKEWMAYGREETGQESRPVEGTKSSERAAYGRMALGAGARR